MSNEESRRTTNHDEIRNWIEHRNGNPAKVQGTEKGRKADDGGGLLRIDFEESDVSDDPLERISWEEFFEAFENENLAFIYQEQTEAGATSRFCKLVAREEQH
ncbi:hypothetical protein SAMN05421858_1467 [Haladaptatus litoreus]|uniref:1,4-alpha-glucan branching enzyme n=1 Tax=Haladaptatus litoreus TaxID=553468 RepID=A0A1N6Y9G7_9EURY|nr:hypothetical protein [Haladaptatus litoreus]SIR11183.1 hypothetical protein SAMN05421858_1467 [Haladaptatus litoreus]